MAFVEAFKSLGRQHPGCGRMHSNLECGTSSSRPMRCHDCKLSPVADIYIDISLSLSLSVQNFVGGAGFKNPHPSCGV